MQPICKSHHVSDVLYLPPSWETPRDGELTVALTSAQRSERRAENRLIKTRLKRIKIEQELYSRMEQHTSQRLRKADTDVGTTRGVSSLSGLAPVGEMFDIDSESDVEVSS
ncbi:hypothetical protein AZE42_10902 [Rhizopogon vesiculosus]|uniref:Uncharacterized protein n=1 Tax=Rhizopogon vesiculosus TaxID=180088 RepID=A0A1J8Q794_9AGAM|nr:hypothetical protein AZE42_10902 [Rhizopogon vesiculosus]